MKRGIRTKFKGKEVTLFSVLNLVYIVVATGFYVGFPFVMIYFNSTPLDLYIEPEYISAILTASSILFGLYVIAGGTDETKLKSSDSYTIQKRVMFERLFFLVNLMAFLIGVLFLFGSIIGTIPTLFTLCILVSNFISTCMLLVFQLLRKIAINSLNHIH